jgi:hypothetical protein
MTKIISFGVCFLLVVLALPSTTSAQERESYPGQKKFISDLLDQDETTLSSAIYWARYAVHQCELNKLVSDKPCDNYTYHLSKLKDAEEVYAAKFKRGLGWKMANYFFVLLGHPLDSTQEIKRHLSEIQEAPSTTVSVL